MKLKQADVRKMFPGHTIVFHPTDTLFYAKADKKKETVVARIAVNMNDSLSVWVPMGKSQTLKSFGSVNLLKGGRVAIRKTLEDAAKRNPDYSPASVTEKMVDAAKARIEIQQFEIAITLLASHWNKGVDTTMWEFLTAPAKHEFHYTGTKKPAAVSPVQQLAETLSKRPRGSKIPHPDEELAQKVIKDVMKAADKNPRQPRAKKVTEGQALLALAGAHFDGNGKLSTNAKPARKPRTVSPAKAPSNAKANGAMATQGKWSKEDDALYGEMLDALKRLTGRIGQLESARRRGISVEAYDAKAKQRRAAK